MIRKEEVRGKKEKEFNLPFKPKKELGQNFIFDNSYLEKIAEKCLLSENNKLINKVVEIGPGYGNLTSFLAKNNKIYCFEKDKELFEFLNSKFLNNNNVNIFLNDVLEVNWISFFNTYYEDNKEEKIVIVGNLPYSVSNKLISEIFKNRVFFEKAVFLVQKEVAERWVASPTFKKNKYSYLSLFLEYLSERSLDFEVPKKTFFPMPKVDGCVVTLRIRKKFAFSCKKKENSFLKFAKSCFNFRRKNLLNNVKGFIGDKSGKIEKIFKELEYKINIRPQELRLEDYLKLYNKIFLKN